MSVVDTPDATLGLVRLLQLASPALPIGAYSYSQGLEWVIESGVVRNASDAERWIGDLLELVMAPGEAAVLWRALIAAEVHDWSGLGEWNAWFRASRDTAELAAETQQMGAALFKLGVDLELLDATLADLRAQWAAITLPVAFALVATALRVPPHPALTAYLWSWMENQVLAAMKLIPLGQVAGQRLMLHLGARIPQAADVARSTNDDAIITFAPGLALASAKHETQYTRLFRS